MARPSKCRRICEEPEYTGFSPSSTMCTGAIVLTVDEYEVIRLVDLEKATHEECARQMDISRTTVTEIYESARTKIADSIVNGKVLTIRGGNYRLCNGDSRHCCHKICKKKQSAEVSIPLKGDNLMRIAVTYENGNIFGHFGHTAQFKIYDVENGAIVNERVVDTSGSGHGALAGFLSDLGADVLICGGIGGGAQDALSQAGIKLYGGVSGSADSAVEAFLKNELLFNPNVKCSHHDHEHNEGHTCGNHGCGNQGCH